MGLSAFHPRRSVRLRARASPRLFPAPTGRHACPHSLRSVVLNNITVAAEITRGNDTHQLYPPSVTTSAVLHGPLRLLFPRCALTLAGLVVSNTCFVLSALSLYWRAPIPPSTTSIPIQTPAA